MVIVCVNAFLCTASLCSLLFVTLHIKYTNFEHFLNTNMRFPRTFLLPFTCQFFGTNVVVIVCVNAFLCTASLCSLLFVTLNIKYTNFEHFLNR